VVVSVVVYMHTTCNVHARKHELLTDVPYQYATIMQAAADTFQKLPLANLLSRLPISYVMVCYDVLKAGLGQRL
jgi:hypothetical protein